MKAEDRLHKNTTPINHLLFTEDLKLYGTNREKLDSLVQTVRIFSEDIQLSYLDCTSVQCWKCKEESKRKASWQHGNRTSCWPTNWGSGDRRIQVTWNPTARPDIKTKMKNKITTEYTRRVMKLWKSKLNRGNLINGVNARAVGVARYGVGIFDWTKEELVNMDRRTSKIMAMNGYMHTKSNVARLSLQRKVHAYIQESNEWILKTAKNEIVLDEENLMDYKKRTYEEMKKNWKEKALHGECTRKRAEVATGYLWRWLRKWFLKKETEGTILAPQEQALRTNSIKFSIDKTSDTPLCRLRRVHTETIGHMTSGCSKLALK